MKPTPSGVVVETADASARQRGRPMKARPKLLEAAIQEFAESGFEGATTAAIARRAKVPQPLVHHHFGSKEELFREVLDVLFEEFKTKVLGADAGQGDVAAILRRFILFTARRPELMRIWLIESGRRGPHAKYVIDRHIAPLTELMKPLLRSAVAKGRLPAVDEALLLFAAQGIGSYPFLVTEQVRRLSGVDPRSDAFAERYADAVLRMIGLSEARR
jgi:AcrR family transcriptional regulator